MLNLKQYLMKCGHIANAETTDGKPACVSCDCQELAFLLPENADASAYEKFCTHSNFQIMKDTDQEESSFYIYCPDCGKQSLSYKNRIKAMYEFLFDWKV